MRKFKELDRLRQFSKETHPLIKYNELADVKTNDKSFPIISIELGPSDPTLPTFGLFGGIHGLEKVGTHIILYYLESLKKQLSWDSELEERLSKVRIVSIPMVNPAGVYNLTRSNPNGVDLMRNAPVTADDKTPFLIGGQSISSKLPWYKGDSSKLEIESQTLINYCKEHLFKSQVAFALDIHSGFGIKDRLWYPYAKTKKPFPLEKEALIFSNLLNEIHPYHIYNVESQSKSYLTDGDLWDYVFDLHYRENRGNKVLLPWCLEMGSWLWIKKNPKQLLSGLGIFHPVKPHRYRRIMRRHYSLLDFFSKSLVNHHRWLK